MSGCEKNTPTFLFYGIKKLSIFEISDIIFRYNIFYDKNTKEIINTFGNVKKSV